LKRNLLALSVCSLILLLVYRFHAGHGSMRYSMEIIFRIAVSLIAIGWTWRANKYIALFLTLALFSQFYPMFSSQSARGFYNAMCGVILYTIIVEHGKDWVDSLMDMMCIVALANVLFVGLQALGIHILWQNAGDSITGLMENPNSLSATLALCFPAFLRKKWFNAAPWIVCGLFLAKSSGGMVAVMIGLCFYAAVMIKDKRYLYPVGLGVIVTMALFLIFFDKYTSYHIRLEAWTAALDIFKRHWLVGCGIERWHFEFMVLAGLRRFPEGFIRLHSTILQGMLEMGIGFIIILAAYLVDVIRRSRHYWQAMAIPITALIIILCNGSVNFLIRIAPNAALVIVWLAIMEISLRRLERGDY
jgi:hypothetical protein